MATIAIGSLMFVFFALLRLSLWANFEWHVRTSAINPWQFHQVATLVGVDEAVGSLNDEEQLWHRVSEGIGSGDSAWLRVANHLAKSNGAHTLEETYAALSVALDKNPELVFELGNVKLEMVCALFDDAHGERTVDLQALYVQRVKKLRAMENGRYAQKAAECRERAKYLLEHAKELGRK
ncbi:MAG: hypothetical protein JNJ55_00080 [Betaproteobacteria bacterium]|nr:hypothetical protein [Betaproteobacteria bacterium]